MGLSGTDVFVIVIFIFGISLLAVFYSERGNYVTINSTFNPSLYTNKSICDDVNCTDIERYSKSIVKTTTTTTTTLKIFFFNTSGATSSLVKTNYGDILVDCGDGPSVMDKAYFSGSSRFKNVFITKFDVAHGGGCSRVAMMVPHGEFYDSGFTDNITWINDYVAAVGDSRKVMKGGNFSLGKINMTSRILDGITYLFKVSGKGFSVAYIGDCSKDHEGFSDSNTIVCDSDVGEDVIMRHKFKNIVVFKSDAGFDDLYRKYGITAYKMDFNKDYVMIIRDSGFTIEAKKGI